MRELSEIVAAFESLSAAGKPAALATVIGVEGSSYRRPGARMLVAEDGRTWGGVSGGCLERDVAARGRGVIATGRPIICRYDTGDDEVPSAGASTGCGGAVELLLQPVSTERPGPIPLLARVLRTRMPVEMATVVRASGGLAGAEGTCLAIDENTSDFNSSSGSTNHCSTSPCSIGLLSSSHLAAHAHEEACRDAVCAGRTAATVQWPHSANVRTSDGEAELFVERIFPPQALVVFGAGPDAVPVVSIAKTLGWQVTVVGARPATGMKERFSIADAWHVTGSEEPTEGVAMPPDCAVVVMTHNIARDQAVLCRLPRSLRYLGILGPRHRTERILARVENGAWVDEAYSPMGLNLGAQTPEEIALSVIAEIQAVVRQSTIGSLRDLPGPIHSRAMERSKPEVGEGMGPACAI